MSNIFVIIFENLIHKHTILLFWSRVGSVGGPHERNDCGVLKSESCKVDKRTGRSFP